MARGIPMSGGGERKPESRLDLFVGQEAFVPAHRLVLDEEPSGDLAVRREVGGDQHDDVVPLAEDGVALLCRRLGS